MHQLVRTWQPLHDLDKIPLTVPVIDHQEHEQASFMPINPLPYAAYYTLICDMAYIGVPSCSISTLSAGYNVLVNYRTSLLTYSSIIITGTIPSAACTNCTLNGEILFHVK